MCGGAAERDVRAHTESEVVEGINHATSNKLKQPEGHTISGWHWFNDAIAAAAKAKAASAAPTAPKPATNAPGAAFKGSLAVLDNNDAPTQSDLRILFEADTTKLLHPKLFRDPDGLRRLLKAQAALHGCSPAQVLDAIAEVLRHAAIHGKAAVADDVLRSGALICKHVRYWRRFEFGHCCSDGAEQHEDWHRWLDLGYSASMVVAACSAAISIMASASSRS